MFRRDRINDKYKKIIDGFNRIKAKSSKSSESRYDGLVCQKYDDDEDPLEQYMTPQKELWEMVNQDGLKIAIRKFSIDYNICDINQRGLCQAHAHPKKFNFTQCLEWKKELENEYFQKYGVKFEYKEIKLTDEIKNKICLTDEYKANIELVSKSNVVDLAKSA